MKKIIGIFLIVLVITGCSIKKVSNDSFDSIINSVLYEESNLANVNFDGYKFYLPRGSKIYDKDLSNIEIRSGNNTYYLYVDMISYYYKTKKDHVDDNSIFYSKSLNYNNKFGYIDVSQVNDKYFIEVMYNYAKIESYVDSSSLYDSITDICYILESIKYNDATIKYRLNDEEFKSSGEEFDIFTSKKNSDNFLEWVEKFDKYEDSTSNKTKDQDIIETDEN